MNNNKFDELEKVLEELHSKGMLDLDAPLRDILKTADKDGIKVGAKYMLLCDFSTFCIIIQDPNEHPR